MNIHALKYNKLLPIFKFLEIVSPLFSNDKFYLRLKCFLRTDGTRILRIDNPTTFNDKINWLKLYACKPEYTKMVDKFAVKEYVANIIGEEYIIPTLGVYDNVEDINWESLPNQFVLKCTHDSGGVVICKDKEKLDIHRAKAKLVKCLKSDFYSKTREKPYKDVQRRIIAEKYMEDPDLHELRDYKFFCFDGMVKMFKVDFDRYKDHHANYYDTNCSLLSFGEKCCPPKYDMKIDFPDNIRLMMQLSERLAKGLPFVRIDLYNIQGKIYFGEITHYPMSGIDALTNYDWEKEIGSWIKLP